MTSSSRPSAIPSGPLAVLEGLELVTFDCFGTLVDWAQALPSLGLDTSRMPQFLKESERRQRPDRRDKPFMPYRALLQEVGEAMRPDLDLEEIARWARRFGELPFFEDTIPAIQLLGSVVDVGVITNCDPLHQLDVTRRLGRSWDVCVVADELEAYKPTDKAWDRAIQRVMDRGYDRDRWLHVSAWDDYDLAPAAARGLRTGFVPRPGGVAPQLGSFDVAFADLLALARGVAEAKEGPFAYEVEAEVSGLEVMARYVEWLSSEHLGEIRKLPGVRRAELVTVDGLRARSVYRFTSRSTFDRYIERDAPRLRARGRELFSEEEVRFSRTTGIVRHLA